MLLYFISYDPLKNASLTIDGETGYSEWNKREPWLGANRVSNTYSAHGFDISLSLPIRNKEPMGMEISDANGFCLPICEFDREQEAKLMLKNKELKAAVESQSDHGGNGFIVKLQHDMCSSLLADNCYIF